ncbi:MAG: hypothetical protein JWM57_1771 [Phycisphaerales bacterium]|nr:hypothetical protein [Phycisphaerales bacterium]
MTIFTNGKFSLACFYAVAVLFARDTASTQAGGLPAPGPGFKFDQRTATSAQTDYEVYELVPGCDEYEIGDTVTLMEPTPPPYETTVGGSGLGAETKVRLIPQRPAS